MSAPARPLVRYHGGKWRIAPWIISFFPEHRIYTEAFGGGGSVLLRKPRSYAEIYNDLDGEMVNLFRVVRDHGEDLRRLIALTPYARDEFDLSFKPDEDSIEQARRTVVRSFMGFGGNLTRPNRDQTPQRTGWRTYTKEGRRSTPAGDWHNWPEALVDAIERLRGVTIENRDALAVILEHDTPSTLHYVDPPYVHATRRSDSGGSIRGYRFEMTDDAHRELADVLSRTAGSVVVSGYACQLYEELYAGWDRVEVSAHADGARDRVEVLWMRGCRKHPELFETEPRA